MKNVKKLKKTTPKRNKKSHNKDVPCVTFIFNDKNCLCCSNKMIRISGDERYLSDLNGRKKVYLEVYTCNNEACPIYKQRIKPSKFNTLIFPGLSYGIDVIAKIGALRLKENKTIAEIHRIITEKHPHIEITERHMQNVINKIMYVIESSSLNPETINERLLKKNPSIKGLVLSVDGLQPEIGNEILYIIREVQTGEILFAKFLEFSDEEAITKELYKPLKKIVESIKLPILGLIADKQLTLTTAFKKIFPNVPIQHCQSHFLKALREPIQKESAKMAKDIKKTSNSRDGKSNGRRKGLQN